MDFSSDHIQEPAPASPLSACGLRDLRLYQIDENTYDPAKMTALLKHSTGEGFDLLERMNQNFLNGTARFDRPGEALICAEYEGRLVAICGSAPDPSDDRALQLRHGYVLPELRQLGIATAMLKKLICDLPAGQYDRITLRAYFPPVRKFCEHHGFRPVEGRRHTHELAIN